MNKMLNLLNNSNNYSLVESNLLSYGLILGSLTIVGFSMYYFSTNLFKQNVINNLQTPADSENIRQIIIKNLEPKTVPNLDNVVSKLGSSIESSSYKVDNSIQTMGDFVNANVQTGTGL
jgi:hypothetical protein